MAPGKVHLHHEVEGTPIKTRCGLWRGGPIVRREIEEVTCQQCLIGWEVDQRNPGGKNG